MPSPATSRIVVLHLTKYSDHALILHTVDSVAGRCSYLVRGIKRGNAVAAFHPLSLLDIVSAASPKSSLGWLREWEPALALHDIRGSRVKSSLAMFISEVLYRSFTNELSDPRFFDWLCEMIATLEWPSRCQPPADRLSPAACSNICPGTWAPPSTPAASTSSTPYWPSVSLVGKRPHLSLLSFCCNGHI